MDFKVRCIENQGKGFTVGKIYNVADGQITTDSGSKSDHSYTSVEKLNSFFSSQFELVPDRPRICEVLGVEVGEKFDFIDEGGTMQFKGYYVNENGNIVTAGNHGMSSQPRLEALINGKIKIIRTPQFSAGRVALLRLCVNAGYPYFNSKGGTIHAKSLDRSGYIIIPRDLLPEILDFKEEFNAAEYLEAQK